MAVLKTNFKDDILDTSVNTRRRYRMYENTDGTVELEDVTEYSQVGDTYGAGQINATNVEVNNKFDKNMLVRDMDTINAITKEGYAPDALALKEGLNAVNSSLKGFEPILDDTGKITGYKTEIGGADTVFPFSGGKKKMTLVWHTKLNGVTSYVYDVNGSMNTNIYYIYNNALYSDEECTEQISNIDLTKSTPVRYSGSSGGASGTKNTVFGIVIDSLTIEDL